MLKVPQKGMPGYLDKKKRGSLFATALSFLLVLVIYLTGIIIYHNNKSIYTVIAAVAALPAAKALTGWLILFPYHSIAHEKIEEIQAKAEKSGAGRVIPDVVLAGKEKPLFAGLVVLFPGKIYFYAEDKKSDKSEAEPYLRELMQHCNCHSVKKYTEYEAFYRQISSISVREKAEWDALEEKEQVRKKELVNRMEKEILRNSI